MNVSEIIKIENLNKSFKIDFWKKTNDVLKDVSFTVNSGDIYGFLGHNGAGKTTTIKILNGLISSNSGIVELWGKSPSNVENKNKIGYLPENPSFYDYLTGREFLEFYADLYKLHTLQKKTRIEELLKLVKLQSAADRQLRKYSKGMIQRIGLAQALINDPELIILDEPLSGLDPIGRYEVRDIILKESLKGKTIFFSSHLLSDVELICDTVTILVHGRVVASGKIEDLVSRQIESWDITIETKHIEKISSDKNVIHSHANSHLIRLYKEKDIEPLIKKTFTAGGKIKSIIPNRKTLEELFIDEMKKGEVA
ncbi:MAG: ABC transporter ATP-binding protein [Acidobacteria bacterium]|nr:ABC transporter ATP-binding protein [Acidobacteriota bacterium]